ncbi:MAG: ERCC4 domain-containing protein [Acidobacteriales bacterium]|nr:ERCC4 domain-containing protein [Terriglobales bacterium]
MAHPAIPVLAERGGTQLQTPRATVLVDTREQTPFELSRFEGWFTGIQPCALPLGDYSIAGMEAECVVERKDLPDLVHSLTTERSAFLGRLRRMAEVPHRLLVVAASLSEIKSPYSFSSANPNRILQSLLAVQTGLQIPFVCSDTHELGEELVASYLYQVHLSHWLEQNGFGPAFSEQDL